MAATLAGDYSTETGDYSTLAGDYYLFVDANKMVRQREMNFLMWI